jgi:hypothetical protein
MTFSVRVNCCWPSPAQSFLVSGPVGLTDWLKIAVALANALILGLESHGNRGYILLSDGSWSLATVASLCYNVAALRRHMTKYVEQRTCRKWRVTRWEWLHLYFLFFLPNPLRNYSYLKRLHHVYAVYNSDTCLSWRLLVVTPIDKFGSFPHTFKKHSRHFSEYAAKTVLNKTKCCLFYTCMKARALTHTHALTHTQIYIVKDFIDLGDLNKILQTLCWWLDQINLFRN